MSDVYEEGPVEVYDLGDAEPLPREEHAPAEPPVERPKGIAARIRAALAPRKADGGDDEVSYKEAMERFRARDKTLASAMDEKRRNRRRARSVYDAIGFDLMYSDGICEVEEGLFSQTLSFEDVSYQTARVESQSEMFRELCRLVDHFGPNTSIQFTIANTLLSEEDIESRRFFDPAECGENADAARVFNSILSAKMREGSSNIRRDRYITFSTLAPNLQRATQLLARSRGWVRQSFNVLKSRTHRLDGEERLAVISSILRPGKLFTFSYDRDLSSTSPLTAKDYVCPASLNFKPSGSEAVCYRSGDVWCQILVFRPDFAAEVTDRAIASILDLPIPMAVSWHLQPIDKSKAIEMSRTQAGWIQKEVIEEQRRAIRGGYDYELLSPGLAEAKDENARVLDLLMHLSQRSYYFSGLVFTYAGTKARLHEQAQQIISAAQAEGIELEAYALRQREGLNSVLPLGHNHCDIYRDLMTRELGIFVPFTTLELDMEGGGYYGQNALSGNLVICNREELMSPHGFVCGMSGSGKSFAVKREITNTVLSHPRSRIFIQDSTGEYTYLVRSLHGIEYAYGPDSDVHYNPFALDEGDDLTYQAKLAWKIDAVLAMTSALKSDADASLTQEERSIITKVVESMYRDFDGAFSEPLMEDFVERLEAYEGTGEDEARRLALVFGRYTSGTFSFLNHPSTPQDASANLISFNIKDVPGDMRSLAMISMLESIRQEMYANHGKGISTWVYIDEIQSLTGRTAVLEYLARLWREGRKYGLICTGMTQSGMAIGDNDLTRDLIDQSGFVLLLRQGDEDRAYWAERKGLSQRELEAIDENCEPGCGLLIADGARVPFRDDFPKGNVLYDIFNTDPKEYARRMAREKGAG